MTLAAPEPGTDAPSPREMLLLAVPSIVLGAFAAGMLWALEALADLLQEVLWDDVPGALGVNPDGWWIVLVLTVIGLAVGLCLRFLPGHGGPDSATTELIESPLALSALPALAVVTVLSLAGGVSLGPENPIIAINVGLIAYFFARVLPKVPGDVAVLIAGAATTGALFGTPVAAALIFTEILAAVQGRGSLWDKLFLPLVAAGSGAITMRLIGGQHFGFKLPPYGDPVAIDVLTGVAVACGAVVCGLVALWLFPHAWRGLHALRTPVLIPVVGGFLLGILGLIGGPITMFKGLHEMGELLADPGAYDAGDLAVIAAVKTLALVIAASALFRGGRVFPATFIGVALGMLGHVLIPSLPLGLAVACGVLGILLVVTRDGWLSLFLAVAIPGDITLLPILCVIVLPAWLMVSRMPEFRIVPPATAAGPTADPSPTRGV
ncbi:ion channel protein [Gordonia caeni]|uniref:Ion channel protein n=1 Tax=Gordonia caeni TaxID=1007097 RepID=A0ABP7PTV2_9ACTN